MDAQNAAEPAFKKPAASPKRPGSDADHARHPTATKSSSAVKPEISLKDSRPSASGFRPGDEDGVADGNSDAETIVLPGKDGHSPSKVRKIIKHEKSDAEDAAPSSLLSRKHSHLKQERELDNRDRGDRLEKPDRPLLTAGTRSGENMASLLAKKKKQLDKPKNKDGSGGLSSAPGSPPPPQRRRRSSNAHSKSDSETALVDSTNIAAKDKAKPLDKVVPHKRKAPRPDSDDEAENRKIRRQRTSGSGLDASRKHHLPPPKPHQDTNFSSRARSISPHSRVHRRSISTHLPAGFSNGGLGQKKKRIPAPLSTDYQSDESSASGSPHPRSSKLRGMATPATAESTVSPAKLAPHKKHLDAHGQTFLARACAKGEYDIAKHRLQERPEDIDVADYAGNTPLQIAALNGYDDIVRLLVDAGCNLDCVNNDKDTPLLDAVENGHLDVVKILLDAGVNPRKANAYGQEPIDRVNDDLDNADEIRTALQEAKQKMGERRRTSEEHHPDLADARSSHGPDSPRRSPGAPGSIHAGAGRRAGTVRATKTSNHLLYMPMDDKTLRAAAARGDEETVTRILQVRENFDDPESMVAAARGGHDIVMQLLLALGRANPDPAPVPSPTSEYSTPILAAIGQENIKVVRLLLDQTDFDPTRRVKGETYYEIAKRRRGPNWMEEEHMLKGAYDVYKKAHKDGSKTRSPARREQDREPRRKVEAKDDATKGHKRKATSPTREPKKPTAAKQPTSPKEKRRPPSVTNHHDDQTSPKRGPGRPKKEDRVPTIAISDREPSPAARPAAKVRRAESDLAAVSSEGEAAKPRRKLVSGRELKGERDRQHRRPSLTSNASTMKEPSSPREEPEKTQRTEKYRDRTKALKRDESRDRLSVSGESTVKRYRSSATPPHSGPAEKDGNELPAKRRRLDAEAKEKRPRSSQSDDRMLSAAAPRDLPSNSAPGPRPPPKTKDDKDRRLAPKLKKADSLLHHGRRESGKSVSSEGSIHVKSEDPDIDMVDVGSVAIDAAGFRPSQQKEKEEDERKKQAELEARAREAAKRKEDEQRRREEEEREKEKERLRREEEEETKRIAEAETRKREEEQRRREEEEQERMRKEEEERKMREEEERKQREEEERRRLEEEEKKKQREEAERRRLDEEKRQKEEEERKKQEEEERLRREQLEREAAEEARRKQEEEEKREQERKERALREETERRRAAREAERAAKEADQRRIRLEQERSRLAKLPPVLRWLGKAVNPKLPEVAEKFSTMQGVRYDCINPEANGTRDGREQWLLNTQVALLLGERDLELSRYTAWSRIPVSPVAKRALWRLESDRYALTTPGLFELGEQLQDYYQGNEPHKMGYRMLERLRAEAWEKFAAMEMFFVKASDFLYIIPTIQHLRNVKLTVAYCELPENETQCISWAPHQKWRRDPGAHGLSGFAPSNKHYVNGELVSEDKPGLREASASPFPRQRVPRRGFLAIPRDGHGYARAVKEQGLDGFGADAESPLLPNGVHSSPISGASRAVTITTNGLGSPTSMTNATTNGAGDHPISPSSEAGLAQGLGLANGTGALSSTG